MALDPVYQALLDKLHADLGAIDEGSAEEAGLTAPVPKATVKEHADKLKAAAAQSSQEYLRTGLEIFMTAAKLGLAAAKG